MTRHSTLRIAFFIALIAIPALLIVFAPHRVISGMEKRDLAPRPVFRWSPLAWGAMIDAFESYFNDHFGLRQPLARSYHYLMLKMLGKSPVAKVIAGRDGWLFTTEYGAMDDHRGGLQLSDFQLDTWKQALETKRAWLAGHGIRHLFVVAPDKGAVYPEFVPKRYAPTGKLTRLDQLLRVLGPEGCDAFVDLRGPIRSGRNGTPLYYRTDVHWTQPGAFIGYRAIMDALALWYPELIPLSTADLIVGQEDRPGGDLAVMLGLSGLFREQAPTLTPRNPGSRPMPLDLHSVPPNKQEARLNPDKRLRAVFFHDSMCVYLAPYLSEHFAEAIYIARDFDYNVMMEIIARSKPDIVIEINHSSMLFGGLSPAEYHVHEGNRFAAVGRFEAAARQYREAIRIRTDHIDARINLGNALDRAGRSDEAIGLYVQALSLDHRNPDLLSNLGAALIREDRLPEAFTHLSMALKLNPRHNGALFNMGVLRMREGRNDEALTLFSGVLARQPDMIDARIHLARLLLAMRRFGDAVEEFETAVRLAPGHSEALTGLEQARKERDKAVVAIEERLHDDLRKHPDQPDIHYRLGVARQMAGDYPAAAEHYENALSIRSDYPEALFNLGRVYTRLARLEEALAIYRRFILLQPDIPDAYYNMACIHAMRNEPEAALERLRQSVDRGFSAWHVLQTDPDIAGIRSTPFVRSLIEKHVLGGP